MSKAMVQYPFVNRNQGGDSPMEKENKLGTMPISKLIINMTLPIIASMLVQALYNIVDSVFVSRVCEQALTAVSPEPGPSGR